MIGSPGSSAGRFDPERVIPCSTSARPSPVPAPRRKTLGERDHCSCVAFARCGGERSRWELHDERARMAEAMVLPVRRARCSPRTSSQTWSGLATRGFPSMGRLSIFNTEMTAHSAQPDRSPAYQRLRLAYPSVPRLRLTAATSASSYWLHAREAARPVRASANEGACRSSARERQVPSGTINDEVRQSLARNLDLEDTRLDY